MAKWLVLSVFCCSCLLTVMLILLRPYLWVRVRRRRLRVDTYFLGALLGPLLLLILGMLSWTEIFAGLNAGRLQPLGVLALFLSMVFISIFLDITGVFEYCARIALRGARGSGVRLFFTLYAMVALLTVFTSNDIIILTFTPLVYYFTKHARLNPVPYLIAEFFAANTWSMLLYIGTPTNIVLAGVFNISFLRYTANMFWPTLAAGGANLLGLYLVFRNDISRPLAHAAVGSPRGAITDLPGAIMGVALLVTCILALILAPHWGLPLWLVALAAALGLLLTLMARRSWARLLRRDLNVHGGTSVRRTLGRMPWSMIPFMLALFVMVTALRQYGLTPALGQWLNRAGFVSPLVLTWVIGLGSALGANLLNNIPMTLTCASIISALPEPGLSAAAFAATVGVNLGANLTPLGALAGIMWMNILHDKEVSISFREFVRYGLMITPFSLAAALLALTVQLGAR
ncbi:MAG: SLC13 family permease [Kiritimatiellia bacterium]